MGLLSSTQLILGIAAAVVLASWAVFILIPAWTSYGRLWERLAASFLTLFMLAALVTIGVVGGVAIIWFSS